MNRLILVILLLASLGVQAADFITATISITNAPIGNTNTLTINGSTRSWTNDVTASPGTLIQETNSIPYSATNLLNHVGDYPVSFSHYIDQDASNNVTIRALPGYALTVSQAGNWAAITYVTNTASVPTFAVRVPLSTEAATNQTNIASMLVTGLGIASNKFLAHWSIMSQFPSLTNNNVLTGTNSLTAGGWNKASVTNAVLLSGILGNLTNGYATNLTLGSPIITNGVNHGNAFSSPGSGTGAEQFGTGATATNDSAFAAGYNARAGGEGSIAIGNVAIADFYASTVTGTAAEGNNTNVFVYGTGSQANGLNSGVFGPFSIATYSNSVVIGAGITSTKTNQVIIGNSLNLVEIPGQFMPTLQTNTTHTGNQLLGVSGGPYATLSISRYDNSTLANNDNLVDINGSSYIKVSGPSAAFAICNITNSAPAGVVNGMRVLFQNNVAQTMTVRDASGTTVGVAANRILTGTGADITITNTPGFVELIYDAGGSRWGVISHSD